MNRLIASIIVATTIFATALGGPVAGGLILGWTAWLLLVLRPAEAGALVADWSHRRSE